MISIRRIHLHEGWLYKRIRLASLSDSPDAFSTTLADAARRNSDSWNEQAESSAVGVDRVTVLAFYDDEPVGFGAIYRDDQDQEFGELIQFWVDPDHRGGLVAGKLLEWIFSWASDHGFERLMAWINTENERAIRFYRKYGFELTDEAQSFRTGSGLVSCLLVKALTGEQDPATHGEGRLS